MQIDNGEYKCVSCDKPFKYKSDYERHINRKTPCNENDLLLLIQKKKTCQYCNKVFKRADSIPDHLTICKIKLEDDKLKEKQQKEIDNKIILEQLLKEMHEVKQKNLEMHNEIQLLKSDKICNKTKTIVKGNMNNTNNIQQNIHNEIKIIAYGKEDLSYITNENYRLILNKGFKSVPHLVEYIHFNQNKPENHNIYISNMRDNLVLIFDGIDWQLKERDDILQDMIDNNADILYDKFEELVDTLDEGTIKKFKRFLDEKDQDRVIDQIKKDLKLMLYNNKKIKEIKPRYFTSNTNKIIKNDKLDDIKLDDIKLDS